MSPRQEQSSFPTTSITEAMFEDEDERVFADPEALMR